MWKDHLFISLAIEHYNPLGAIRALGEAGIRPVFIGIKGRVQSRMVEDEDGNNYKKIEIIAGGASLAPRRWSFPALATETLIRSA